MKYRYSLRTMLIVVMVAPAVLAGIYFAVFLAWNWQGLPQTLKTPADGDPPRAGEFLGVSSTEQAAVSLNSSRIITFPSRIGRVEAEYQHNVEVIQFSPYSIEVAGRRTGAAEFIVWLENGKKTTIQISVAEK